MERKIIIPLIIVLFLQTLSASIIINQQPQEIYSIDDIINLPVKVTTTIDINEFLKINLICSGIESEIHKEFITLNAGNEKTINPQIPLFNSFVTPGNCKIKTILGDEFVLTKDFKISDKILLELDREKTEFNPGDEVIISGTAKKENGKDANGIIETTLNIANVTNTVTDTVKNGFFSLAVPIPESAAAGTHMVSVNVYENSYEGNITNKGLISYAITVKQIPKSLEILFENQIVQPGTDLNVRAILHDQTGEKIDSIVIVTIKNNKNKILDQREIAIDEAIIYPILESEPAANWTVVAVSNRLSTESKFTIPEKMDAEVSIINRTVQIRNSGNVQFNKTLIVKIGEESVEIETNIPVGETHKFVLTAPDGEYKIEILKDGESVLTSDSVFLTGKVISVKKAGSSIFQVARHPFVWVFIIAIMGFMGFMIAKKGYRRSFIGKIGFKRKKPEAITKGAMLQARNRAIVSLSLKGQQQDATVVCLKIKNLLRLQKEKTNAEEILQKIVDFAEESKAATYENQDNIFFILSSITTRTFQNERAGLAIAQRAKLLIDTHNKIAKEKIDYGIVVNQGSIIATPGEKSENAALKFLSMKTLMPDTKKISSVSDKEILLGEKIKEKLGSRIDVSVHEKHGVKYYSINKIKPPQEDHSRFLKRFVDSIESEKRQKEEKK